MAAERTAAAFAAGLEYDAIPNEPRDRAGLIVADSLGAIIGGSTTPYVRQFAERAESGAAAVLGQDQRTTTTRAALLNGSAGSVLELDEGHKYCAGHPAMHVLPAVLAAAEVDGGDGRRFLTALVAGYEVCARVGIACTPLVAEYHMHGVWGTVGAAAGVARYRGADTDTTLTAMRIGANYALHTCFDAATEGATVRNAYSGMSAMNGLLAADQAAAGFTGLEDGLARHLDRLCADSFDRSAVEDAIGERWEITRGYFKNHAACRYTHGALDALERIEERTTVDPDDVEAVTVETYPAAARLTETAPENGLEAKFSLPFAVATRLCHGTSTKPAFTADAVTEETLDLADRVSVSVADDLAARVPDARSTRVRIRLKDGRSITEEIRYPKGDAQNPLTEPELQAKFHTLVEPVLGPGASDRLWDLARSLPEAAPREICQVAQP